MRILNSLNLSDFYPRQTEKTGDFTSSQSRSFISRGIGLNLSEADQKAILRSEEACVRSERIVTPLTESQFNAYASVMCHQLTVIHGPPGTGKTELEFSTDMRVGSVLSKPNLSLLA